MQTSFGHAIALAAKGEIETFDQRRTVERLVEIGNGAFLQCPRACSFFRIGGNENNWRRRTPFAQAALQLQPAQARHVHVDDQTSRLVQIRRIQELFGRGEGAHDMAQRPQKTCRRHTDRFVVVNDANSVQCPSPGSLARWLSARPKFARALRTKMARKVEREKTYLSLSEGIPGVPAQIQPPAGRVAREMPSNSAMRTRSASERAPILRMTWPRWIFTVISLTPISPATCLFIRPGVTRVMTSRSRGVRVSSLALISATPFSSSRLLRSRSSALATASSRS